MINAWRNQSNWVWIQYECQSVRKVCNTHIFDIRNELNTLPPQEYLLFSPAASLQDVCVLYLTRSTSLETESSQGLDTPALVKEQCILHFQSQSHKFISAACTPLIILYNHLAPFISLIVSCFDIMWIMPDSIKIWKLRDAKAANVMLNLESLHSHIEMAMWLCHTSNTTSSNLNSTYINRLSSCVSQQLCH